MNFPESLERIDWRSVTTLIKRSPLKRKPTKRREGYDDPNYRAWLKEWPCFICFVRWCEREYSLAWFDCPDWLRLRVAEQEGVCCSHTEVAHVGLRGLAQRCKDRDAMPLGRWHHEHKTCPGGGPESHHSLGKRFWEHHGIERETILTKLRELYTAETGREV